MTHPLDGIGKDDLVEVSFADGELVRGNYFYFARMHFMERVPVVEHNKVYGPFKPETVLGVTMLRSGDDIREERVARLMGEPVPGREPQTRDDYEHRLTLLARLAVRALSDMDTTRWAQLTRQFDACAERIQLAQAKRIWMMKAAKWGLTHNSPPVRSDLIPGRTSSPADGMEPRPQDFDPDPSVRRKKAPLPAHAAADPRSIPNMLRAMREQGLEVSVMRLGDDPHLEGALRLKVPSMKGRVEFWIETRRGDAGRLSWSRVIWGGNSGKSAQRLRRRAEETDEYRRFAAVAGEGGQPQDLRPARAPEPPPAAPLPPAPAQRAATGLLRPRPEQPNRAQMDLFATPGASA